MDHPLISIGARTCKKIQKWKKVPAPFLDSVVEENIAAVRKDNFLLQKYKMFYL